MLEPDDAALLREYTENGSETAFTTLVERYVNLVYSIALRRVGNPQAAEEITQAVFTLLAKKAKSLGARTVLTGWFYQTTQWLAANFLRDEYRRQKREREAAMESMLNKTGTETWSQIAPLLDDALAKLGERDRNAILLRFFDNKDFRGVGMALGTSEPAAKMRVNRALDKLRRFFVRRGIVLSAAAIGGAVSANSVHAAPAGLAKTISAMALTKSAVASTSTLTLVKGALKLMAWTKANTAVAVGAGLLLATGTTTITVKAIQEYWIYSTVPDLYFQVDAQQFQGLPKNLLVLRPTHFTDGTRDFTTSTQPKPGQYVARMLGRNASLEQLMAAAFGCDLSRVVPPVIKPNGNFDYMVTVPSRQQERLQAAVKRKLGYTAHWENRETDVLLLETITPNPPAFRLSTATIGNVMPGRHKYQFIRMQPASMLEFLDDDFRKPVLDRTGLTNFYDFSIEVNWNGPDGPTERQLESTLNNLGLKLKPATESIPMLVVEKAI
jgi:uncharacterized protein (TIGR03435 family)